jgi:hypothetical protein
LDVKIEELQPQANKVPILEAEKTSLLAEKGTLTVCLFSIWLISGDRG